MNEYELPHRTAPRRWLGSGVAIAIVALLAASCAVTQERSRPDVVLITVDTLRADR